MSVNCDSSSLSSRRMPPEITGRLTDYQFSQIGSAYNDAINNANIYTCAGEWCLCCFTGFWPIFCCHPCISLCVLRCTLNEKCNVLNRAMFNGHPVLRPWEGGGPLMGITINYGSIPNAAPIPAPVQVLPQPVFVQQPEVFTQPPAGYVGTVPSGPVKYGQPSYGDNKHPTQSEVQSYPMQHGQSGGPTVAVAEPVYYTQDSHNPYGPPSAAMAAPAPSNPSSSSHRSMQVVVPEWATPGSTMTVNSPTGEAVNVTVPPNQPPGSVIIVNY